LVPTRGLRERIQVHGFGVFIVGVYPGAFVDLNSDQLAVLSPARQLRVYCAGVWHNFVLSAVCVALLAALPSLMVPLYAGPGGGATVHFVVPVRADRGDDGCVYTVWANVGRARGGAAC
jgi:S2P endopeptidase